MYERYVGDRLPALSGRCVKTRTCLYTVTPDSRFLIDRLPSAPNVIVASPCSGHGFKHSAAIGEALAQLALSGESTLDLDRVLAGRSDRRLSEARSTRRGGVSTPLDRRKRSSDERRSPDALDRSGRARSRLGGLRAARRTRGRGTRSSRPRHAPRWPGSRGRSAGGVARARATASALSAPLTTNHTSSARFSAGKVSVTRSGGGLGESVTATAIRVVDVELRETRGTARRRGRRGRRRASRGRSDRCPRERTSVGVRRRAPPRASRAPRRSTASRGREPGRPRPVEEVGTRRPRGVALVGVGRDEALVTPEEVDLRPVDLGPERQSWRPRGGSRRRWCRRSGRSAGRRPRAWLHGEQPAARRSGHRGGQVGAGLVDLDARGRSSAHALRQPEPLAGRTGVDLVLVETAQLLGQQLGELPRRFSATGRSG